MASSSLTLSTISTFTPPGCCENDTEYLSDNTSSLFTTSSMVVTTSSVPESRLTEGETVMVHSIAVGSLGLSLLFSFGTVFYLLCSGPKQNFRERKMAERLVVYLALCDLCYSTEHIIDHCYLLIYHTFPADPICTTLSFFLQGFATMQGIIVVFTAVNAFALIVRERGLSTGRRDWRLLSTSLGVPILQGIIFVGVGAFGPSEAWCMTDKRKWWTRYVDLYYAVTFVVVFVVDIVCYALVFYKIHSITRMLATYMGDSSSSQPDKKRSAIRSARTMCVFVMAYLFQWFGYITYSLWSLLSPPPVTLLAITALVTNMGGAYNCVAYTLVRRIGASHSSGGSRPLRSKKAAAYVQSEASLNSISTVLTNSS